MLHQADSYVRNANSDSSRKQRGQCTENWSIKYILPFNKVLFLFGYLNKITSNVFKISPPSPTENVTLKCDACDTEFKKPSKFRQHQETKCGTRKPYLCNLCGSSFISENTLRVHSTIHTEKKHFLCPICGSSFLSKGELKVHERTHTKETPFKCDVGHYFI